MVITLTVFGAYFYLKDVMNTEAPGLHPRTMGVRRLFFSGDSKKFPEETKHSVCLNKTRKDAIFLEKSHTILPGQVEEEGGG